MFESYGSVIGDTSKFSDSYGSVIEDTSEFSGFDIIEPVSEEKFKKYIKMKNSFFKVHASLMDKIEHIIILILGCNGIYKTGDFVWYLFGAGSEEVGHFWFEDIRTGIIEFIIEIDSDQSKFESIKLLKPCRINDDYICKFPARLLMMDDQQIKKEYNE